MMLSDVARWTRGQQFGEDVVIRGVGIDSRTLVPGNLFVALPGERSDGHQHLPDAARHGAVAALVSQPLESSLPQVRVADAEAALGQLAAAWRAQSGAHVVGITGSNGKTTVKALAAAILATHGTAHVNAGNYNNEIGLPLSLLAMPVNSEYAVFEMGAGKPGDIARLAAIAKPQVGLVNNVAPAHLERMKSLEGVAETKGALYTALPDDGAAIINADDDFADYFEGLAGHRRMLLFGLDGRADVRARDIELAATGSRFTLATPRGSSRIELPLPGRHNIHNALAAAAIGLALAVPMKTIAAGLARATAVPGRLEVHAMPGDWQLIDDSYNANPASLAAAIDSAAAMPGETWLVLGDMGELGEDAAGQHAQAGAHARRNGVRRLWTLGDLSAHASDAFGAGARHFDSPRALADALLAELHAGVNCLVKGSRAAAMERVVVALRAHPDWGDRNAA